MGKKKKNKNQYREDQYDKKPAFAYGEKPKQQKNDRPDGYTRSEERKDQGKYRPNDQPVEYSPVALLLRDEMARQITNFLEGPIDEDHAKDLFDLGSDPARLAGCEGAEDYEAWQLDRSVRLSKDNPENLNRLSTIIVVTNMATHKPAFLVQAFISPNRSARVLIHEQGESGTIYRNTLRWSNN